MFLRGRERLLFAVDGTTRGGEDNLLKAALLGCLQKSHEGHDIYPDIARRIGYGDANVDLRRMVVEDIRAFALDDFLRLLPADIALMEFRFRVKVFLATGRKVVETTTSWPSAI